MPRFEPVADARPDDGPWPEMVWPLARDARLTGRFVELSPVDLARDGADLFAALDHPEVWEHTSTHPRTAEEYVGQLERAVALGRVPWVVRLRREVAGLPAGAVVGTSSYLDVAVADARLEIGSTAYARTVWGSTVNPETKLLLMAHAFETLEVGRVQLKTDVRNVRSQLAIARLGATYEGTLRRYQRRTDGSVRDTVMFSVTAEEWPDVKQGLENRLDNAPGRVDSVTSMTQRPTPPERTDPPLAAGEQATLEAFLDYHRATLLMKCAGLTDEQLRSRAVPPSSMSLLGLVRHLTDVERGWFRRVWLDEDAPPLYWADGYHDHDFDDVDTADVEDAFRRYHEEVGVSRRITAAHSDLGATSQRDRGDGPVSLRWIYAHMIEEYARHNGHADLLRERLDGVTGE